MHTELYKRKVCDLKKNNSDENHEIFGFNVLLHVLEESLSPMSVFFRALQETSCKKRKHTHSSKCLLCLMNFEYKLNIRRKTTSKIFNLTFSWVPYTGVAGWESISTLSQSLKIDTKFFFLSVGWFSFAFAVSHLKSLGFD